MVDTHCHIHSADYPLDIATVNAENSEAGISHLICVGTDVQDSAQAVQFVQNRPDSWAAIGIHPHESSKLTQQARDDFQALVARQKVVAIGECGLDYFYNHSPKEAQIAALRFQIELALAHNLPLIFHVREAFDDFWPIFDEFKGLRGVLHSFTDTSENMHKAIERGLCIGVNGIATFTKVEAQKQMYRDIPLKNLLLETDAPFLTPVPYRGSINRPAYVAMVATFLAELRHQSLDEITAATTTNARQLFSI